MILSCLAKDVWEMELGLWVPCWQPDRTLDYPGLEGPRAHPAQPHRQPSNPTLRPPSWVLACWSRAGMGRCSLPIFHPSFLTLPTPLRIHFPSLPNPVFLTHPTLVALSPGQLQGLTFRLGFSQCVPVCLHFQAACWALPRTLLTLLLLTLNAWCDSQSSGDL